MKKIILAAVVATSFCSGIAVAAETIHDWRDLNREHDHLQSVVRDLDIAAKSNRLDIDGHAAKALEQLHLAEQELKDAVTSAKNSGSAAERKASGADK